MSKWSSENLGISPRGGEGEAQSTSFLVKYLDPRARETCDYGSRALRGYLIFLVEIGASVIKSVESRGRDARITYQQCHGSTRD